MLLGRLIFRRGRNGSWEKRARCGIAVPDVVDGQDAGGDGAFSPPAQRGPECHPTLDLAETLRRAASPRLERAGTPKAREFRRQSFPRFVKDVNLRLIIGVTRAGVR
jgi:hypothetical protein